MQDSQERGKETVYKIAMIIAKLRHEAARSAGENIN